MKLNLEENRDHWTILDIEESQIPGIIGLEADQKIPDFPEANETTLLATSPIPNLGGEHLCEGTRAEDCPAHMIAYQHHGGAKVFAAGTVTWTNGLDEYRPPLQSTWSLQENDTAKQITHNVLDRFQRPYNDERCEFTRYRMRDIVE